MALPLPLIGLDRWSDVRESPMAQGLREYILREPLHADGSQILGLDSLAVPVMNATPVPAYTLQLCNPGLPFRVNVIVEPEFFAGEDADGVEDVRYPVFQTPPFVVVPTDHDGIHNWTTFLNTLRANVEYKINTSKGCRRGSASTDSFV